MTIFTFALGLLLVAAGVGSLAASLNLLPTELGLVYLVCGVILVTGGAVTLAVGAAVRRLDTLTRVLRAGQLGEHAAEFAAALTGAPHEDGALPLEPMAEAAMEPGATEAAHEESAPPLVEEEPAPLEALISGEADEPADDPVNENRAGRLPTVAEIEQALGEPEGPPKLVGRYSAGGANYKIFSDGSIEAETVDGAFRFASMSDFKAYLAGGRT